MSNEEKNNNKFNEGEEIINKNSNENREFVDDERIPMTYNKLVAYSGNVVKTTAANDVKEETSLQLVLKVGVLRDDLTTADAKQEKLKNDSLNQTILVSNLQYKLAITIRKFNRYLRYFLGFNSPDFRKYGMDNFSKDKNILMNY